MVSTGSGKYRKPNTGMWDYFVQKCNQGIPADIESSLYVGGIFLILFFNYVNINFYSSS